MPTSRSNDSGSPARPTSCTAASRWGNVDVSRLPSRSSRDPRLLLLDEPHAGLDAEGREVLDAVVRAAPSEARTVLVASHELEHARALATREVVITAGQAHLGPVEGPVEAK